MKEVSHTELVTLIRNCEGEVLARVGGEDYCCNPTPEVAEDVAMDAEEVEEAAADEGGETGGEEEATE